jgi:hypothetical protein
LRWEIGSFHKILKSGCQAERSKLRTAERFVNLLAMSCILSWRIFWLTMLNRAGDAPPGNTVIWRGTPGHDAFAAFVKDHNAVAPDDQGVILSVVAHYCDAAMFEQLHAVAKAAKAESELRRYYSALMSVQDSGLAQQAAPFKLAEKQTLLPAAARST